MTNSFAAAAGSRAQASHTLSVAFEDAYQLHAARVHRFCIALVGDIDAAQDLTHETFVRAFAASSRTPPDAATIGTWLLSIARNLCTDYHRRQGRWRRLLSGIGAAPVPQGDVEQLAERTSELKRVTAALDHMNARDRELIGLRVAADLSYREMAQVLGSTESIVKVATFRALTKLRSRLEESP